MTGHVHKGDVRVFQLQLTHGVKIGVDARLGIITHSTALGPDHDVAGRPCAAAAVKIGARGNCPGSISIAPQITIRGVVSQRQDAGSDGSITVQGIEGSVSGATGQYLLMPSTGCDPWDVWP